MTDTAERPVQSDAVALDMELGVALFVSEHACRQVRRTRGASASMKLERLS